MVQKHSEAGVYNLEDSCQIFGLSDTDLELKILEYPGGIGNFNAQMHRQNRRVVSGDDFYCCDIAEVKRQARHYLALNLDFLQKNQRRLSLSLEVTLKSIVSSWQEACNDFVLDFECGWKQGRYCQLQMPTLPFSDHAFDLALCSDLVFQRQLGSEVKVKQVVMELARVAKEVRIFPLLDETGEVSERLGPVMLYLQQQHFGIEIKEVPYRVLSGSNAMLRVWAVECKVGF